MIRSLDQEFEGDQSQATASVVRRHVPTNNFTRTRTEGRGQAFPVNFPVTLPGQLPGRRIFVRDGAAEVKESNGWQVVIRQTT